MLPFYVKENKAFDVEISVDGAVQDISEDSVTCIFKANKSDADSAAVITAVGGVSSEGSLGIAEFNIPKEDTDVDPGTYFWEIKWAHGDAENIIASSTVKIKERVYD
jgi:hypothetical protein